MPNIQDAVTKVGELKTAMDAFAAKVVEVEGKVTSGFNRLDAKIAELQALLTAGAETQPIIDALQPISQKIVDTTPGLDSLGAQADVEGV